MHRLRRRKSSLEISSSSSSQTQVVSSTPLYARFARTQDASAQGLKTIVSEPRALAGRPRARKDSSASARVRKDSNASETGTPASRRRFLAPPGRGATHRPTHSLDDMPSRQLRDAGTRDVKQAHVPGSPLGPGTSSNATPSSRPHDEQRVSGSPRRVRPQYLPGEASSFQDTRERQTSLSASPSLLPSRALNVHRTALPPKPLAEEHNSKIDTPPSSPGKRKAPPKSNTPRVRPSHSLDDTVNVPLSSLHLARAPDTSRAVAATLSAAPLSIDPSNINNALPSPRQSAPKSSSPRAGPLYSLEDTAVYTPPAEPISTPTSLSPFLHHARVSDANRAVMETHGPAMLPDHPRHLHGTPPSSPGKRRSPPKNGSPRVRSSHSLEGAVPAPLPERERERGHHVSPDAAAQGRSGAALTSPPHARSSSRTRAHAHGLPTPPPSSTSSIPSVQPTSAHQMAHRTGSEERHGPGAAALLAAGSRGVPRRKYSLLAAFGVPPSTTTAARAEADREGATQTQHPPPAPPHHTVHDPAFDPADSAANAVPRAQHGDQLNDPTPQLHAQSIVAPTPSPAAPSQDPLTTSFSSPASPVRPFAHPHPPPPESSPGSPGKSQQQHSGHSPRPRTLSSTPQNTFKPLPNPEAPTPEPAMATAVFSPVSLTRPPLAKLRDIPAHDPFHPVHDAAPPSPPQQGSGPVPGRPLIFAAMAPPTRQEPELPDVPPPRGRRPLIFDAMAEGRSSPEAPSTGVRPPEDRVMQREDEQDGTFVRNGYPTPRSPSPPLPAIPTVSAETPYPFPAASGKQEKEKESTSASARPRKISKSLPFTWRRRTNSEHAREVQAEPSVPAPSAQSVSAQALPPSGQALVQSESPPPPPPPPHTHDAHSDGAPVPPSLAQAEEVSNAAPLGSPFQLQQARLGAVEPGSPTRGKRGEGIKVLTERQLEKLHGRATSPQKRREENASPASPSAKPGLKAWLPALPPTPVSPEEYAQARTRRRGERLGPTLAPAPVPIGMRPTRMTYYPLARHLADPALLAALLPHLAFCEWCAVATASKAVWGALTRVREARECVLERYLGAVGYRRWGVWGPEPLVLSLQDLNSYMRGVSLPSHQFARHAAAILEAPDDSARAGLGRELAAACRAYTRVVLRLRAQAEVQAEAEPHGPSRRESPSPSRRTAGTSGWSRSSSRASSVSHAHTQAGRRGRSAGTGFRSPLFRSRRAPLLQVFVPSPEGEWLSDASVLACEAELRRAGVLPLLRAGDVVWDAAVGDEGNVGRMVWDGGYLIDLDYTYSKTGDLPHYLPALAFAPSYFHRVIRTMGSGNPIVHIDISPWAEEIAMNLQLVQDRMKSETPQGNHHTVVRWVHRSSFAIRPPAGRFKSVRIPIASAQAQGQAWVVDPGWYGTVVVEAEATNEGIADLQARCRGAFPPRANARVPDVRNLVFRILREKSRPGEIWIRTVRDKERLL